jgi:hypothetical protein
MKILYSFFVLCTFLAANGFSQTLAKQENTFLKNVTVIYRLLDSPGINDLESKWEVSYELRIISEKESYEAIRAGKLKQMQTEEKIGLLINKGSFSGKNLIKKENREVTFTVPLNEEIQERLKGEPKDRINLANVTLTDEVIKKSREDEARAQVFLIYANALVYDAKLKKTTIIPLCFIMRYPQYSGGVFGAAFKVTEDGYATQPVAPQIPASSPVLRTVTTKQ